jgi:DNA primase catalytic core
MNPRDLAQLKKKSDLAAVARARGLKLVEQGRDFVALCPFHQEASPSFHITPAKNLFHCFGCGAAGSVIDFVMRLDGIPFHEAVNKLLTETGIVQRGIETPPPTETPAPAPERAHLLLERVIAIYQKNLEETHEGKAYLAQRGITDAGLWTRHRIGYSNGRLTELLPQQGQIWDELKTLGVLLPAGQERFTGCVVFPVTDADGNLVTLYGRFTGQGEKRHLYLPGRPTGLWNAPALKTHAHVVLVESILDALSVEMAGSRNVLSIQGTNGLNDKDAALFAGYGVQRVTLLLDGDEPGRAAVEKVKATLANHPCDVIALPDGHDPNSYLTAHGAQALAQVLTQSQQATPPAAPGTNGLQPIPGGFAVMLGLRRYEIRGLEKGPRKLRATLRVEQAGRLHVDTLDFYSAKWRRQLAQDITRALEESADTIEADIAKIMALCEGQPESQAVTVAAPTPLEAMTPEARAQAQAFGRSPDLIAQILKDYERCGLVGERANKLLCYLAMTSRKLDKPLSVLLLSSSGAGKTALQDTALMFCPPEDLIKLTSLSGKALFYKEQSSLRNKVLALEEGDGVQEATYAIRNLISAGELTIEATVKDLITGRMTTMENRVEGPTAVFVTTTNPETDAETRSRFWVTSVDESREQTQAILQYQRQRQTLAGLADATAQEPIRQTHHNFQRLLRPLPIVNPYAAQLRYGDDRLQSRRDQPKYLYLIKAVALLRQLQKAQAALPNAANGASHYIAVDKEDIRLANELTTELLGQTLDELSRPGYDLLMHLEKMTRPGKPASGQAGEAAKRKTAFTRREIREHTGWSQARVHRYLTELLDLEYTIAENGRNGTLQTYRLLYDGEGKDGRKFVPGLRPVAELSD